jgi:hypothetical protein
MASSAGNEIRVVASAVGKHLAAQARVFVHLQHIDAGVGNGAGGQHRQRLIPGGVSLPGEAGNQVYIEVG